MTEAARRWATYEDLVQVPEPWIAEIVFGTLVTHPRPAPKHARAASFLGFEIGTPFDKGQGGPGGWWILDEPELHLDAHVLVPDLAGWRRDRMSALPQTAWFEQAPQWVCEILSPATAKLDRMQKMPIYAAQGVEHLWLIDPEIRTLEAYQRRQQHWLLTGAFQDEAKVAAPPFEAVSFDLGNLWAD
jgi:Uma2 family endonuclease